MSATHGETLDPPLDPPSPAEIAEDLRAVVGRLVRLLRAGYTVPVHQFGVLIAIERSGPQTTSNLAAIEFVRPQSMAHTVQQLTDAGFVTRAADPSDGRQTLIGLSDAGRAALDEQRRGITGWLAEAIEANLDDEEQAHLGDAVALLGRLVEGP